MAARKVDFEISAIEHLLLPELDAFSSLLEVALHDVVAKHGHVVLLTVPRPELFVRLLNFIVLLCRSAKLLLQTQHGILGILEAVADLLDLNPRLLSFDGAFAIGGAPLGVFSG